MKIKFVPHGTTATLTISSFIGGFDKHQRAAAAAIKAAECTVIIHAGIFIRKTIITGKAVQILHASEAAHCSVRRNAMQDACFKPAYKQAKRNPV